MAHGRRYYGSRRSPPRPEREFKGDQMGFLYPPLPFGGSRQVLGVMPTDPTITPPIPAWVPARHHRTWATIWHTRQKQYKSPGSKELIPWDTTHDPMGDYQGYDEYYVKGCFGYDERGNEIRYRPGLPGVHCWVGRGLVLAPPRTRPVRPVGPHTIFQFYKLEEPLTKEEFTDLRIEERATPNISNHSNTDKDSETLGFTESDLYITTSTGIFEDSNSSKSISGVSFLDSDPGLNSFNSSTSRTHTITVNNQERANLVTIPGEIRNQIYGYLLEESNDYEIVWCARQQDLTHYKHKIQLDQKGLKTGWRCLAKVDPALDVHFERPVKDTRATTARRHQARRIYGGDNQAERVVELQAAGPAAFLLTCKTIYGEAMPLFYRKHNFSFSSRTLLHKFMQALSPAAMANISKVYLAHDPQGWPLKRKAALLVEKEYRYWIRDLKKMVECFTGLRELTMLLQIRDSHVNNAERADWAMGLRRGLAGLKHLDKFQHFDLTVRLACDTSNMAWVRQHGTPLQKERGQDLEDLVCIVKSKIFESVDEKDEN